MSNMSQRQEMTLTLVGGEQVSAPPDDFPQWRVTFELSQAPSPFWKREFENRAKYEFENVKQKAIAGDWDAPHQGAHPSDEWEIHFEDGETPVFNVCSSDESIELLFSLLRKAVVETNTTHTNAGKKVDADNTYSDSVKARIEELKRNFNPKT